MRRNSRFLGIHNLFRRRDGTAAVEFAIAAPMLLFSFIAMADIGLAVNQRMMLDQAVRAGASFAMDGVGDVTRLKELVAAAATGAYSDTPSVAELQARPDVTVIRECECPDGSTPLTCSTLCPSNMPPKIFYKISAAQPYKALFIPDINLNAGITVQVR